MSEVERVACVWRIEYNYTAEPPRPYRLNGTMDVLAVDLMDACTVLVGHIKKPDLRLISVRKLTGNGGILVA